MRPESAAARERRDQLALRNASMLENRNLKHDLWALALLAVTVFMGLAVFSYNPADQVGELPSL